MPKPTPLYQRGTHDFTCLTALYGVLHSREERVAYDLEVWPRLTRLAGLK